MEYQDYSIHCGNENDSYERLEKLCKIEADKLAKRIIIPDGETIEVPFWTSDFPELICVGIFRKNESGNNAYELDFSESTL